MKLRHVSLLLIASLISGCTSSSEGESLSLDSIDLSSQEESSESLESSAVTEELSSDDLSSEDLSSEELSSESSSSEDLSSEDSSSEVSSSEPIPSSSEPSSSAPSSSENVAGFPDTPDGITVPSSVYTYYSGVNFNTSGATLKTNLYNKIKGHNSFSYSSLANIMTTTDRDWNLSPNASDTNPYMVIIYASYNFSTTTAKKRSDYTTVWDKEHIWAKAHGNFGETPPAGSDLHHLRASDKNNNSSRGNLDFGKANTVNKTISDYLGKASGKTGSQTGFSGTVYEPLDIYKGDVARAMFYMATRYMTGTPNLTLVNKITSTSTGSGQFGILSTLLLWNELDPVDEFEFRRNGLVQEQQKNRNPYIDFPSLAQSVFG